MSVLLGSFLKTDENVLFGVGRLGIVLVSTDDHSLNSRGISI